MLDCILEGFVECSSHDQKSTARCAIRLRPKCRNLVTKVETRTYGSHHKVEGRHEAGFRSSFCCQLFPLLHMVVYERTLESMATFSDWGSLTTARHDSDATAAELPNPATETTMISRPTDKHSWLRTTLTASDSSLRLTNQVGQEETMLRGTIHGLMQEKIQLLRGEGNRVYLSMGG